MSQYLKRIEIANVGNVEEEIQSQYLKRVHIVEVVDSDGNPWDPSLPEIGLVTINPESTTVPLNTSATFTVVVTGGDATDLTYKWSVRSGNAVIDTPDNQESATFTFIREGTTQIQCSVSSVDAHNSPQSNVSFVIV
jgi:hypothetical protein